MKKVKYRCLGCGWTKVLPADWADVQPRFCSTPTCEMSLKKSKGRKSFRNNPEMLQTTFFDTLPEKTGPVVVKTLEYKESNGGQRKKSKRVEREYDSAGTDSTEPASQD